MACVLQWKGKREGCGETLMDRFKFSSEPTQFAKEFTKRLKSREKTLSKKRIWIPEPSILLREMNG